MAIFAVRLRSERKELSQVEILGKFVGVVGNYNAHIVAYPDVNRPRIAEEFVQSLGLSFNPYVAQRHLTDSTVLRNMGVDIGHSFLAYKSTPQGIGKLQVNEARLREDLNQCWEVMQIYGVPEPYEKLEELTRGRAVTKESIRDFIEGLDIPEEAKNNLLKFTLDTYVGAAVELARNMENTVNIMNGMEILA
ncbi:L-Aspartase-like [Sesbania bispinosa]|nr:L-Aspartase-like [Sesbania bispinosa]